MTSPALAAVVYVLFFLSGAAALVYQVVWVRSLTLVFGGSHLAVTAVLTIFMGGLAIGGYVAGRHVDRTAKPLRLYGLLELGIAVSALAFAGLMEVYPALYAAVARGRDDATLYLTVVRMCFSIAALIMPTVLMGATLPVLSRFVSRHTGRLRSHLSFLYGFNTLGAVLGAVLAGFVFLRLYSVSTTLYIAVAANAVIGVLSLVLQRHADGVVVPDDAPSGPAEIVPTSDPAPDRAEDSLALQPARLVLLGIGVSGFCALGYEVLWTRVLTIAVGASVYGFTIILIAFLTGIALGSKAHGALLTVLRITDPGPRRIVIWFGLTQVGIGVTALLTTVYLRDVPAIAVRLRTYFAGTGFSSFGAQVWASFTLSFLYVVVPAFFMGMAFPIACEVLARHRRLVGRAVGDVLASNTVGAILGAAVSGLLLIPLVGIERSLQILTVVNVGTGLTVLASLRKQRWVPAAVTAAIVGVIAFLWSDTNVARVWDQKYFAIFRSNQPEAFRTPEMVREAVENTDVLYYAEGVESIVSVIKVKGGEQAFITNGRVEASSYLQAQQIQYTLGHLPVLLNPNPRDVLVVGLGSGMTAGATTVHPGVERVTLVEIEPRVFGVARTFEEYNHRLLDNPKLKVVLNDGRNFLMTTDRTFDVITADPIHPWFRGAGYLYSSEFFELAAAHLRPGGVIAQWLPIYELTPQDLASVVRTFQRHFAHTLMCLMQYDAVIVGSSSPFAVDEAELQRRMADPSIAADLRKVTMGSAAELLGYLVMGTWGMTRFGEKGVLNTDDRLYLEFSAPFSIATPAVMAANVAAIGAHRENLLRYVKPAADPAARDEQRQRWDLQFRAGMNGDRALALFLAGSRSDPAFLRALHRLNFEFPSYAPGRFLAADYQTSLSLEPRLLQQASFPVVHDDGRVTAVEVSAVLVPVSGTRASIMFVDNRTRTVYGQVYVDDYDREGLASRIAIDVMTAIRAAYDAELMGRRQRKPGPPSASQTLRTIRAIVGSKVQRVQP